MSEIYQYPVGDKIFYDLEFLEDGRTIDLISIGMVVMEWSPWGYYAETASYYAVNSDFRWDRAVGHQFLTDRVLPSLPGKMVDGLFVPDREDPAYREHARIADEVAEIIQASSHPQLWAWYGAYDHVALCQLWGTMMDLPTGVPMFTCDLKQEALRQGNPTLPEQESGEHNALADARHNVVRARALGVI